jgi:F-type H+-transporting ATPase subunit alpha
VAEQVLSIYAVTNGNMDRVAVERISEFEHGLADYLRTRHAGLIEQITTIGTLPDKAALDSAIGEYLERFLGE